MEVYQYLYIFSVNLKAVLISLTNSYFDRAFADPDNDEDNEDDDVDVDNEENVQILPVVVEPLALDQGHKPFDQKEEQNQQQEIDDRDHQYRMQLCLF